MVLYVLQGKWFVGCSGGDGCKVLVRYTYDVLFLFDSYAALHRYDLFFFHLYAQYMNMNINDI